MTLINEMSSNPEARIIEEIKNGNEKVLTKVYKKVYRHMERFGLSIGVSSVEIEESVQDAFEVFYRQILSRQLNLTSTVDTYIISIARRIFLANDRQRSKLLSNDTSEPETIIDEYEQIAVNIQEQKHELFTAEFKKLARDCRRVLSFTFKGYSLKEITVRMDYSSEKYTKTKRARCRNFLIEKIKENPYYETLRDSTPEDIELFIWGNDSSTKNELRKKNK